MSMDLGDESAPVFFVEMGTFPEWFPEWFPGWFPGEQTVFIKPLRVLSHGDHSLAGATISREGHRVRTSDVPRLVAANTGR